MDDPLDNIVYRSQVAHVTFSIIEDLDGWYRAYTETKKEGKFLLVETEQQEEAWYIVRDEIALLEQKIEHLRKGQPTPRQLFFLFSEKIPIPLTLTWGEASDLIDERLTRIALEKQAKQQAKLDKFNGFAVGDRVSHLFRLKNIRQAGKITQLKEVGGQKLVRVKLDDGSTVQGLILDNLQKIDEIDKSQS